MGRIVVVEFLTLDGVMQAPGEPNEDRTGGFDRGGWQRDYFDDTLGTSIMRGLAETGGIPARSSDLRHLREALAEAAGGRPARRDLQRPAEVGRLDNAARAVAVGQLDADLGRRSRSGE